MDKIGKNTGPGKVIEEALTAPGLIVSFLLFNYNHDGNLLKPEHKEWIDSRVIPLLKRHKVHAKLMGLASTSGAADYNQALSLERVLRVKKHLLAKGIPEAQVPGPDVRAAGEAFATGDDERDRAVKIVIGMGTKPRPLPTIINLPPQVIILLRDVIIPLPPKPPEHPKSQPGQPSSPPGKVLKEFRIQQVGAFDIGLFKIIGGTAMQFVIVDPETNKRRFFKVIGLTGGVGSPIAVTDLGPENTFYVPQGTRLSDLDGKDIRIFTPVATKQTSPFTTFDIVGISTPQPLQTGTTIGITLAGGARGPLQAVGTEIEYTGPLQYPEEPGS